jgi:hypothetical protein
MKNIYTLITFCLFSSFFYGQTIYLTKDFNDLSLNSGGWTTQVVVDTTNWYAADYNGDQFAKISNYNNGNVPSEAWLISPAVDLSNASQPNLSFGTIMKFAGAALTLYISTDYDGTSNPTSQGTWIDITSNANWDTNNSSWGNWTNSGDIDLSSFTSSSIYVAYKYTGTSSDGSTWEVDDILIKEGTTPTNIISIYDIQFSTASSGDSPYENQQVSTGGIVNYIRYDGSFYIQSGSGPWTGIYVFDTISNVMVGDSITLDAEVVEYYDLTELKNLSNLTVVSSMNSITINSSSSSDANSELYEGCLIKVPNAQCTNANGQFGEWTINDGSGPVQVDDFLFSYSPTQNLYYTVTGLIDYSFGAFKLLPRDADDVEQSTDISEFNSIKWNLFPNPISNNTLNITSSIAGKLEIINVFGQVIQTQKVEIGLNSFSVNHLSKGNYIVKLNETSVIISKQ